MKCRTGASFSVAFTPLGSAGDVIIFEETKKRLSVTKDKIKQMVIGDESLICNHQVGSSILPAGTI